MAELDLDSIRPLLTLAHDAPEDELRIDVLAAAARFPLDRRAWQAVAEQIYRILSDAPPGSDVRRAALAIAVQIPLLSLRNHLRSLADNPDEPDSDVVAAELEHIHDRSRLAPALRAARAGGGGAFELLAAIPLEEEGVVPADIPPLPAAPPPNAGFWHAFILARLGDFGELDAILENGTDAALFWGSPWTAYAAIAAIRPIPVALRDHLVHALQRFADTPTEQLVQLITWAATGIADAEGRPLGAEGATGTEAAAEAPQAEAAPEEEEGGQEAAEVAELVAEGNRRAADLEPEAPANVLIGNDIIKKVLVKQPTEREADTWPVDKLALEQVNVERPALDDEQMAWVLSRTRPARVIQGLAGLVRTVGNPGQHGRLLHLLGNAADHYSGRAGSPLRGAGGGAAAPEPAPLIDDLPRASMARSSASADEAAPDVGPRMEPKPSLSMDFEETAPAELDMAAADAGGEPPVSEPIQDRRKVHARILHQGTPRNTFLTGAENTVRCWIGLPQPEAAAVADDTIPTLDIPPEGLPLTAMLSWGAQSDSKPLLLPANRDARTGDCDLHLQVPDGEQFVCADIAFLYRGRVFEVVQVQAFALPAGEAEQPHHQVWVKVQAGRRQVIELPERAEFDATLLWGRGPTRADQGPDAPPPEPSLRVFGHHGSGQYSLKDAATALEWMNASLFAAEKSLVRRRAAQAGSPAGATLDADDPEVLELLRDMARHGTVLFNRLRAQKFEDPGGRIQLLNQEADGYVPLEFVYDQGYPADDARLCDGWQQALLSDDEECPVCSQSHPTEEQRVWMPTICPLGFWSLQKIIERLDPDADGRPIAAPNRQRRALLPITYPLFASSHRVTAADRDRVWTTLTHHFANPGRAETWIEWRKALKDHSRQLLLILPHHDVRAAEDYLEIGDEALPPQSGRLHRGQLVPLYVNPKGVDPGPIVILLGCRTAARTEVGYAGLAREFQHIGSSIVLGTLAPVLGRHAAQLADELIDQLVAVTDSAADLGTVMRRVRRRMLANGNLMAFCVVALGDAEWHLTPRVQMGSQPGGGAHVSP